MYPRGLTWKAERGRRLGRHKNRWENNIKVDLKEIGSYGEYLIYLCHDKKKVRAIVNKEIALAANRL
jgi:hypothetical protein